MTILEQIVEEKRREVARLPERLIAAGNPDAFVNAKLCADCLTKQMRGVKIEEE